MGKSAGRAPAAPDPRTVANAQADANITAARATAALNNQNVFTPFGSLTYEASGNAALNDMLTRRRAEFDAGTYRPNYGTDEFGNKITEAWRGDIEERNARAVLGPQAEQWTARQTLSPQAQALVDNLFQDAGANGGRARVEEALFQRINPSLEQDRQALETRLRNQGLTAGGQAWNDAMGDYNRQVNDARLAVTAQGGAEQQRAIQALLQLAGAGPGGGAGGGGGGGTQVAPADLQSAFGNQQAGALANYNARAQNAASGNAAAAGVAAAAITAAAAIA